MTEEDIRRIIREELDARAPQIVVIPPHPQPMPRYMPQQLPMPPYHFQQPYYPHGPWPVTCSGGYGVSKATQ